MQKLYMGTNIMTFRQITLEEIMNEAPIDNYELVGNWGDEERSNSFADKMDRKAIQSPKLQAKVYEKFGNTDYHLNFFFVNLPGMRKWSEHGIMDGADVAENFPLVAERIHKNNIDTNEAINIIFVSNTGFQKVKMTPWIMAHRIGHVMNAASRSGNAMRNWQEYNNEFFDMIRMIMRDCYNWDISMNEFYADKKLAKFYEQIGTMKSAVNGKLGGRPYEFVYEIFAQYITTGSLKFRDLPLSFGMRGQAQKHFQFERDSFNPYMTDEQNRKEQLESMSGMYLDNGLGIVLPDRIDSVLYEATGKFFVM